MAANVEELEEPLRSIVKKILAESGGKVTVVSARRSRAEQEALYQKYLNGTGNLAAKPGSSRHEHGEAVDFGGDLGLAAQLAAKYGLFNSVPGEPWHFTVGEGADAHQAYDPTSASASGGNPQDVLASRLHSVLRIMGQDQTGTSYASSPSFEDEDADAVFAQNSEAFTPPTSTGEAAAGAKGALQQYAAQQLAKEGMNPGDIESLITLWNKESGWDPTAQNPTSTAFGIAQFLNGTWAGTGISKTTDPYKQIDAGLRYIKARYGSPAQALKFHLKNNWY